MNLDKLKAKLNTMNEKGSSGPSDSRLIKFGLGRNTVRFLPPVDEDDAFYHEEMVHNLTIGGKYTPVNRGS